MATDPVCGMQVDEQTAAGSSVFQGSNYYFCSAGCKKKFEATPSEYFGTAVGAPLAGDTKRPEHAHPQVKQRGISGCVHGKLRCGRGAAGNSLYLPWDATGSRARCAVAIADLRHGVGADRGRGAGQRALRVCAIWRVPVGRGRSVDPLWCSMSPMTASMICWPSAAPTWLDRFVWARRSAGVGGTIRANSGSHSYIAPQTGYQRIGLGVGLATCSAVLPC